MQQTWILELPLVPKSYNSTRYAHWSVARREHKTLAHAIQTALHQNRVPRTPLERIEATALLTFPTNRRRDTGNYRTPLEKALGDVLQTYGTLADDTPDKYEFGYLRFNATTGPHKTLITLTSTTPLPNDTTN